MHVLPNVKKFFLDFAHCDYRFQPFSFVTLELG